MASVLVPVQEGRAATGLPGGCQWMWVVVWVSSLWPPEQEWCLLLEQRWMQSWVSQHMETSELANQTDVKSHTESPKVPILDHVFSWGKHGQVCCHIKASGLFCLWLLRKEEA